MELDLKNIGDAGILELINEQNNGNITVIPSGEVYIATEGGSLILEDYKDFLVID